MVKKDPKDCNHRTIMHILNGFECIECGLEFIPKDPKFRKAAREWHDAT